MPVAGQTVVLQLTARAVAPGRGDLVDRRLVAAAAPSIRVDNGMVVPCAIGRFLPAAITAVERVAADQVSFGRSGGGSGLAATAQGQVSDDAGCTQDRHGRLGPVWQRRRRNVAFDQGGQHEEDDGHAHGRQRIGRLAAQRRDPRLALGVDQPPAQAQTGGARRR